MVNFGDYLKTLSQTVLPDRSILMEQKLVENAKIQKFSIIFKLCASKFGGKFNNFV